VNAVEPEQHLVLNSIRHPWCGKRLDPSDEQARAAHEDELRRGGVLSGRASGVVHTSDAFSGG
jgi:hypothetical protein